MSLFETFAADSALILSEIGRDVTFRGQTVKALVADPTVMDVLAVGGFSQSGSGIVFKMLRSTYEASLPNEGELIGFPVVNGVAQDKWVITAMESRPLSAWVKMDCKRWDS